MMQIYDYEVIEYSNEGSESTANEKVVMLTSQEKEQQTQINNLKEEIKSLKNKISYHFT
jgi:hypothetical protein